MSQCQDVNVNLTQQPSTSDETDPTNVVSVVPTVPTTVVPTTVVPTTVVPTTTTTTSDDDDIVLVPRNVVNKRPCEEKDGGTKKKAKVIDEDEMANEIAAHEMASYSLDDKPSKKNISMQSTDGKSRHTKDWEDKIKGLKFDNDVQDDLRKYYAAIQTLRQSFTALTKKMLVKDMCKNGDEDLIDCKRDEYLQNIEESFPEDNSLFFDNDIDFQKKVVDPFNGLHEVLKEDLENALNNIVMEEE